jgi:hypothetical protein
MAMTNEIDAKAAVNKVSDSAAEAMSHQAFDSFDILKFQPNVKDEIGKTSAKQIDSNVLGKLEILNHSESKMDWSNNIKQLDSKLEPLNKTETMIMNSMQDAIRSGSLAQAQEMLATLAENPKSVDRVMQALKHQMESENPLNSVNWEQGQDNHGNNFVRLNLYHADSFSKSAGGTELTIGSDGRNSATYRGRWDSPAKPMDAETALQEFASPKLRDYIKPGHDLENKPGYDPGIYSKPGYDPGIYSKPGYETKPNYEPKPNYYPDSTLKKN